VAHLDTDWLGPAASWLEISSIDGDQSIVCNHWDLQRCKCLLCQLETSGRVCWVSEGQFAGWFVVHLDTDWLGPAVGLKSVALMVI
jgi:hypothetical protein